MSSRIDSIVILYIDLATCAAVVKVETRLEIFTLYPACILKCA